MATQKTPVSDTFSGTDTASADLLMPHDGVVVFDALRTAGSIDVRVQISVDGGTTFVNAYGEDGTQLTASLTSAVTHARFVMISLAGEVWRVASTQVSSGTASVKFGPALAP